MEWWIVAGVVVPAMFGLLGLVWKLVDWTEKKKAEKLEGDFEGEAHWREPEMWLHVRFRNRSDVPKMIEDAVLDFGPPGNRRRVWAVYESDLAYLQDPFERPVRYGERRDVLLVLPLPVPRRDVVRGPLCFRFGDDDHKAWTAMTRKDRHLLEVSYDGKKLRIEWPRTAR